MLSNTECSELKLQLWRPMLFHHVLRRPKVVRKDVMKSEPVPDSKRTVVSSYIHMSERKIDEDDFPISFRFQAKYLVGVPVPLTDACRA